MVIELSLVELLPLLQLSLLQCWIYSSSCAHGSLLLAVLIFCLPAAVTLLFSPSLPCLCRFFLLQDVFKMYYHRSKYTLDVYANHFHLSGLVCSSLGIQEVLAVIGC